jgi:hypothetical protein
MKDLLKKHGINSFKPTDCFYHFLFCVAEYLLFHYPRHEHPTAFDKLQASDLAVIMSKIYNVIQKTQ